MNDELANIMEPAATQTLLASAGVEVPEAPGRLLTQQSYRMKCRERWWGKPYRDACSNWGAFNRLRPVLEPGLRAFKQDPFLQDRATGKCANPNGTLIDFLWAMAHKLQPNPGALGPLLDFEEHHQKCFLRRGLFFYAELMLREIEAEGSR